MTRRPLSDDDATLGALLHRPYAMMSEWLYAELSRMGFAEVRPAFSAVLRNLPPAGARVSDLAMRAGMTKQSMAYLVRRMETVRLVAVVADANDRRASTVRLTVRGEQAMATAIALSARYEAHLAAQVGERRMMQLRATLRALCDAPDRSPPA